MNKTLIILMATAFLSACSDDPDSSWNKAVESAKETAQHAGKAVSESTSEVRQKWSEANANRIVAEPDNQTIIDETQADGSKTIEQYRDIKKQVVEKAESAMDKAREMKADLMDK